MEEWKNNGNYYHGLYRDYDLVSMLVWEEVHWSYVFLRVQRYVVYCHIGHYYITRLLLS